jgi:hypothetical protein
MEFAIVDLGIVPRIEQQAVRIEREPRRERRSAERWCRSTDAVPEPEKHIGAREIDAHGRLARGEVRVPTQVGTRGLEEPASGRLGERTDGGRDAREETRFVPHVAVAHEFCRRDRPTEIVELGRIREA